MSELLAILCSAVALQSREHKVALLLSGGLDSLSVGLALQSAGIGVHAYTFSLEGYSSRDLKRAKMLAGHYGWALTVITVPTDQVEQDFIRLAVEHRCKTKVQFEVTYPLTYVMPQIRENEVFTGFNADDHFGNNRECVFRQRRFIRSGMSVAKRKEAFDEERKEHFVTQLDNQSDDTWWFALRSAEAHGKTLHDPYLHQSIRDYFLRFDHEALSSLRKPLVRAQLAAQLESLPIDALIAGVRLQIGSGVDRLFETLLDDPNINRFETRYVTVSALCQRWGREVTENPTLFRREMVNLPRPAAAESKKLLPATYRPYMMADVRAVPARFTALAMFAGGGGTCVGVKLAGGQIVLANEFVREAARTHSVNFPDTPIDPRDIRDITVDLPTMQAFLQKAGYAPGQIDVCTASPPCGEFSLAGRGISDQSKLRSYSDTKQRGTATLPFEVAKLARALKPKTLIVENVPDLATRHGGILRAIVRDLRSPDTEGKQAYFVNWAILCSGDYGVPQDRQRLIILGVRQDVARSVGITRDDDVAKLFPEPSHLPVTVRAALAGLEQTAEDLRPWLHEAMTTTLGRDLRSFPPATVKRLTPRNVGLAISGRFMLKRCAWNLPAPTLTALGQQPNGQGGALHPQENRKFTLPELKRLTSLPDDFHLTGTVQQAAERIGRMVPPLLMHAIADAVYQRVLRPFQERKSDDHA